MVVILCLVCLFPSLQTKKTSGGKCAAAARSRPLLHEILVEGLHRRDDAVQQLLAGQNRRAEVERVLLLLEARARNDANARRVCRGGRAIGD